MAKPPSPTANTISFRLTDNELAQIDRAAAQIGVSRNEWIRRQCATDSETQLLERGRSRDITDLIVKHSLFQSYLLEEMLCQTITGDVGQSIIADAKSATAKFLRERGLAPRTSPPSANAPETNS